MQMPTNEKRNAVAVEIVRLNNSLKQNRLVQANGITQKVHDMILEVINEESAETEAEKHPWWGTWKAINRIKDHVLGGKTAEALGEAMALGAEL
jgi:hypothetical protein